MEMNNMFVEKPLVLLRKEYSFKKLNVISICDGCSLPINRPYDYVIDFKNQAPTLCVGSQILVFDPYLESIDLNNISDLNRLATLIVVEDTFIEFSYNTNYETPVWSEEIAYSVYIKAKRMPPHKRYEALCRCLAAYIYSRDCELDFDIQRKILSAIKEFEHFYQRNEKDDWNRPDDCTMSKCNCGLTKVKIDTVIFCEPKTIILWSDGSQTMAECNEGETFSKEVGFTVAVSKHFLGSWDKVQEYVDNAILSESKEYHRAEKQKRKEKCLKRKLQKTILEKTKGKETNG